MSGFFSEIKENDDGLSCLVRELGRQHKNIIVLGQQWSQGSKKGGGPEGNRLERLNIFTSPSRSAEYLFLQMQD